MSIENRGEGAPANSHPGEVLLGITVDNGVVEEKWGDPALLPESDFQQASPVDREDWKLARSIAAGDVAVPSLMTAQLWNMIEAARKIG